MINASDLADRINNNDFFKGFDAEVQSDEASAMIKIPHLAAHQVQEFCRHLRSEGFIIQGHQPPSGPGKPWFFQVSEVPPAQIIEVNW